MSAVPLPEAARQLGLSPATVRRDIAAGAPCVRRGSVGRGKGSLLDLEAYRRWRAGGTIDEAATMERIGAALFDVLKRDGGAGEPAHVTLGIRQQGAAALLLIAFERIHRGLTGRDADVLPPEIARLVSDLPDSKP